MREREEESDGIDFVKSNSSMPILNTRNVTMRVGILQTKPTNTEFDSALVTINVILLRVI